MGQQAERLRLFEWRSEYGQYSCKGKGRMVTVTENEKENININIRWLYLGVGTAALLFAGIIYAWSILKAPLAREFGWSASQLSINFTCTMCFFCIGGVVGGVLAKRIGEIGRAHV